MRMTQVNIMQVGREPRWTDEVHLSQGCWVKTGEAKWLGAGGVGGVSQMGRMVSTGAVGASSRQRCGSLAAPASGKWKRRSD